MASKKIEGTLLLPYLLTSATGTALVLLPPTRPVSITIPCSKGLERQLLPARSLLPSEASHTPPLRQVSRVHPTPCSTDLAKQLFDSGVRATTEAMLVASADTPGHALSKDMLVGVLARLCCWCCCWCVLWCYCCPATC